jgi:hypothetical protein
MSAFSHELLPIQFQSLARHPATSFCLHDFAFPSGITALLTDRGRFPDLFLTDSFEKFAHFSEILTG